MKSEDILKALDTAIAAFEILAHPKGTFGAAMADLKDARAAITQLIAKRDAKNGTIQSLGDEIGRLTESCRVLSSMDTIKAISAGLEDVKAGRFKSLEQVEAELEGRYYCHFCASKDKQIAQLIADKEKAERERDRFHEALNESADTWRKWYEARGKLLREALETMIKSAYPHPVEHPTMTAAWENARAALAQTEQTEEKKNA